MPIDLKKCCGMHSKEREDSGKCCQEKQERAEALTYEQTFINKSHFVVDSPKQKDTNE